MLPDTLNLQSFFPYQLWVLYDEISQAVTQVYGQRFALTRNQWQVLATLGTGETLPAKIIATRTRLEKMPISRAVEHLYRHGYVEKFEAKDDKRQQNLALSQKGQRLFEEIAPLVLAREAYLLSALSEQQREQLQSIMTALLDKSRELNALG